MLVRSTHSDLNRTVSSNLPIAHWSTRLILTLDQAIGAQFPACIVPIGKGRWNGEVGILGRTVWQNCQQTRQQSSYAGHFEGKDMGAAFGEFQDMAFLYHKTCMSLVHPILYCGEIMMRVMGPRDQAGDVEKKACKVPFSCRVVSGLTAIHAIYPCKWLGLTDAGYYIIRCSCHCVVMSDSIEPCPTWHL